MKKKRRSLVEIKNLCLKIKGRLILNNISFSLEYNENVGVVGESGSGKSLMANILMLLGMFASRIASALLIVAIRARSNAAACLMNRLLWSSSVITFSKYDADG